MSKNFRAELVACLGQPVAENPTGAMQEAAFRALGLNWRYLTIEVPPDQLGPAITGVRAFGMKGINLTIPQKVAVMEHLDEIAPDAAVIGAVNTVRRDGARLIGENTDGKGFLRGVRKDAGIDPKGKRAVVLGAGGACPRPRRPRRPLDARLPGRDRLPTLDRAGPAGDRHETWRSGKRWDWSRAHDEDRLGSSCGSAEPTPATSTTTSTSSA